MLDVVTRLLVGLLPVLLFLFALIYLDSYKLVRLRSVLGTILLGALIAILCYLLNTSLLSRSWLELATYQRYVSPVIEEVAKALILVNDPFRLGIQYAFTLARIDRRTHPMEAVPDHATNIHLIVENPDAASVIAGDSAHHPAFGTPRRTIPC